MKIKNGVNLHIIKEKKFKTVQFLIRFRTKMSRDTVAKRVLISNLWETSNEQLPTSQQFQKKLSGMYGASFATSLSKKGDNHFLTIGMSVVNPKFVVSDTITEAISLIHQALFMPLVDEYGFDEATFDREKKNLLQYLASTREDKAYVAATKLTALFFTDQDMATPSISTVDLLAKETRESIYAYYQKMLQTDTIDISILGDLTLSEEQAIIAQFSKLPFTDRVPLASILYKQDRASICQETTEKEAVNQSILQLGYHHAVTFGDENYLTMQVLNGILGGFSHAKLFTTVREKESLAYYANSRFDSFTGFLKISAGIDAADHDKALTLIKAQVAALVAGDISDSELSQTKNMLRNAYFIALDSPTNLIEQAYIQTLLPDRYLAQAEWLQRLADVTKEDVVRLAGTLSLQAVYFMEGDALGD
ncbi:EF-P 5-aminopentanol modification-associated protein YfmF [Lactococcus carnosus]|uniref:EF-P 5-aminopentanol modification-associated protein YfmF n=1 Tax=Pseudolactococcus carnosus TaxID=2749961 RepID=UPI001FBA58B3|nr:pitrilysin family protein [Lactococcus carnosus]MCJ1973659.1 insulinase family protein [Lactococcus carnosus]MCJ1981636.1 insulinase family protein [Lactococcus carnosus]